MPSQLIDPADLPTYSFGWGVIKPLVSRGQRRPRRPTCRSCTSCCCRGRATSATTIPTPTRSSTCSRARATRWSTTATPFAVRPGPGDLDPQGRVPLDGQHGLGADGAARDLRAGGRRAGAQDAARLRARSRRGRRRRWCARRRLIVRSFRSAGRGRGWQARPVTGPLPEANGIEGDAPGREPGSPSTLARARLTNRPSLGGRAWVASLDGLVEAGSVRAPRPDRDQ